MKQYAFTLAAALFLAAALARPRQGAAEVSRWSPQSSPAEGLDG